MAPKRKCNCGACSTCKARLWQAQYRHLGPLKRGNYRGRVEVTGRELTSCAEDCKELEESFPWLNFKWKESKCEHGFVKYLGMNGK